MTKRRAGPAARTEPRPTRAAPYLAAGQMPAIGFSLTIVFTNDIRYCLLKTYVTEFIVSKSELTGRLNRLSSCRVSR
jgi:hypothetical protein